MPSISAVIGHWNARKRICRFVQLQQQESIWIELPPGGTDGNFSERFIHYIYLCKRGGRLPVRGKLA